MADNHSIETRSYNMSRIRSENTKPETVVCKFLFSHGFRYRKNDKRFPGKPDIVLPKYNAIVFINGCFWHGHDNCPEFVAPKSKQEYWQPKITQNKERDNKNVTALKNLGWRIFTVWECELKKQVRQQTLENLMSLILDNSSGK